MRLFFTLGAAIGALCLITGDSRAGEGLHDGDVILQVVEGEIVTHRITSGGTLTPSRLFDAPMTSFFGFAFTPDPGLDSPTGTFPAFSTVQLNLLDALRFWDEGSFETVAPDPMEISFGSFDVESPDEPHTHTPGPTFAVNEFGKIHVHPDHVMTGDAAPGLYLLAFEVTSSSGGIEKSEPFYYMYIWQHTDLMEQAQAREWVISNLIDSAPPCPWDLTGSGAVGAADLGSLLGCWGAYSPGDACEAADFTNSGAIGAADLGAMLGNWGVCP
ncbi:MAG: hypothetical protein EA376_08825 [Phycisphaeraceae bacterium]|nr:MAG: hypothetical protein EA376_08825 [Phycisphaeraceae bacterium]